MKITIPSTKEVEVGFILVAIPVLYGEEDIPNDFPLRKGEMWQAKINVETGKIDGWPQGKIGQFYMKVCDSGCYTLLDYFGNSVGNIECDYVPHGVIPGEYGDYVDFKINSEGKITNWPKNPDFSAFFEE